MRMSVPSTIELGPERSLHYVSHGEGSDLVLIHGALQTHHDWLVGPFEELSRDHRVTAIDRPGHGLSRRPRFDAAPRRQAAQIHEGLQQLGISRPTLVAHSFGALVALAYAELFPEAVERLILVAPLAFPEARPLEHSLLAPRSVPLLGPLFSKLAGPTIDHAALKFIQRLMFSPQPVPPHWQASFPYDQQLDPWMMVVEGEDAASILPLSAPGTINVSAIRTPTHILTGASDRIIEGGRQARLLARLMPNAELTVLEGIGHMPHHTSEDALLQLIRAVPAAV